MFRYILPALALTLLSLPASAQDLVKWGEAGGWDIMVDPTVGNGCLIMSAFEDGSTVRVGLDAEQDNGYVMAFNDAWGEIVEGQTYPISFDLDGAGYEGEATGVWLDGTPGVEIAFDSEDFILDMARKQTLTLSHDGEEVMSIDLTGSFEGLEQAIACQEAQSS
ncbi:hypothetical protein [Pseudorhodobacter sp.]|uniref:hypothetical protein n=1 Tax=Pseudorhodobacter sp. TaxID=1934400 RepID=UPI002649F3AA|nr:hypothetical protein [Pseudorhodobacter sp.]MDN5788993.1 hypothetical protein [Pseudorhodobacter sp.]